MNAINEAAQILEDMADVANCNGSAYLYRRDAEKVKKIAYELKQILSPKFDEVSKKLDTIWKQEFGEDFNTQEKVKVHTIKTWPEYFQAVWDGKKPWEYRENDRDYKAGDVAVLQEWDPDTKKNTGREITAEIEYVFGNAFGLADGYVIFSLSNICRGTV
jgi:hypothetical protein